MEFESTLIEKKEIAEGTHEYVLEKPRGFDFTAGQYCELTLPIEKPDERGNVRPLSIVSAPSVDTALRFATRDGVSSFKKELESLQPDVRLRINGPLGSFRLHNDETKSAVFLVGGIGITPVHSIIVEALTGKSSRSLALIYANRDLESAAYLKEFQALDESHDNFTLVYCLEDAASSEDARQRVGIIDEKIVGEVSHANSIFYIVGPPAMVGAVTKLLDKMGVDDDHIRFEEFGGY